MDGYLIFRGVRVIAVIAINGLKSATLLSAYMGQSVFKKKLFSTCAPIGSYNTIELYIFQKVINYMRCKNCTLGYGCLYCKNDCLHK